MKKTIFPYIALAIGVFLFAILFGADKLASEGRPVMPLLALLIISEFGFITSLIGAVAGMMAISASGGKLKMTLVALACALMSVRFMLLGIAFWPD